MRQQACSIIAAVAAAAALVSSIPARAGLEGAELAKGREIITEKCSRCHAIGPQGASPHAKAPPFREVVKRYPVENLAESLAEGIVSGHPDMPVFVFEPAEIDAILAYLSSLSPAPRPK